MKREIPRDVRSTVCAILALGDNGGGASGESCFEEKVIFVSNRYLGSLEIDWKWNCH